MGEGLSISTHPTDTDLKPTLHRTARALGRIGAASRGFLYTSIGIVTLFGGLDLHEATGAKGAMVTLEAYPLGRPVVLALGCGFIAFALFHLLVALLDFEQVGWGWKALLKRFAALCLAGTYATLAFYALRLGLMHQAVVRHSIRHGVALLLGFPGGSLVLAGISVGIAIFGGVQIFRASRFYPDTRLWRGYRAMKWIARIGLAGRGLVFIGVALLLMRVAFDHDARQAGGIGQTLRELQYHNWTRPFLLAIGASLIAFGVIDILAPEEPHK